ncbi:MAG TPA: hypothetical protein VER11_15865 [Polyangiaceae bacterium]|nr:hypothetical protein [Polyangiaceae bacterium]
MFKSRASFVLVMACAACGSSFTANDGGGSAGFGNGGDESGGQSSGAGSSGSGDAGDSTAAGMTSGGNAGSAGVTAGSGGTVAGTGGGAAGDQCTKLKLQYQNALEKARVCDQDLVGECSPSSTVEPLGCGCPVLVNAKSEYADTAKNARQAYLDAKCVEGTVCPAIACSKPIAASCAPAATGSAFVCTAASAVAN